MVNSLRVSRRQRRAQSRSAPVRDVRLTFYVSAEEADSLDRAAEDQNGTLSSFLRYLLEQGVQAVAEKSKQP